MKRNFQQSGLKRGLQEAAGAVVLLAAVFVPAAFAVAAGGERPTAWLQVGDDPAVLQDRGSFRRDAAEHEQFRKTQATLIKSPNVLRATLNDPAIASLKLLRVQPNPVEWLRENLSVIVPSESEVLQISLEADDRAEAAKVVNAVVESYLKNVVNAQRQIMLEQYNLIDETVKERSSKVRRKREELARLSKDLGAGPDTAALARERYSKLLELSTDVRKKLCEAELQAIASRIRSEDTGAGAAEQRQAKTELSIAEAQQKFLQESQEKLNRELEEGAAMAINDSADLKNREEEIKAQAEIVAGLQNDLAKLKLVIKMPPRVQLLMPATADIGKGVIP